MNPDAAQPNHDSALQHRLYTAVSTYQHAREEYQSSSDPVRRAELLGIQQEALEQIYNDLHEPLLKLVGGWGRSLMVQEQRSAKLSYRDALESITMSVFGDVAAALQTCKLNPEKNIRNFLTQIARNKLYDQEYTIYNEPSDSQKKDETRRYAMWPSSRSRIDGVWEAELGKADQSYLSEPEDPASIDFDNQLIQNRDNEVYLRAVLFFWRTKLSTEERLIVILRWTIEPPFSFKAIAQRLGEGWTDAAVRQRHHRILDRTCKYLIEQGLVDPSELQGCIS